MAANTQLLKGLMDGVILEIIKNKETYGYEIYENLQNLGFNDFAEGSLYPLLLRLEKRNISSESKDRLNMGRIENTIRLLL